MLKKRFASILSRGVLLCIGKTALQVVLSLKRFAKSFYFRLIVLLIKRFASILSRGVLLCIGKTTLQVVLSLKQFASILSRGVLLQAAASPSRLSLYPQALLRHIRKVPSFFVDFSTRNAAPQPGQALLAGLSHVAKLHSGKRLHP